MLSLAVTFTAGGNRKPISLFPFVNLNTFELISAVCKAFFVSDQNKSRLGGDMEISFFLAFPNAAENRMKIPRNVDCIRIRAQPGDAFSMLGLRIRARGKRNGARAKSIRKHLRFDLTRQLICMEGEVYFQSVL